MTNKLAVIINSRKVPKIKKMLLYEMKFLVPNYSCLQNPWLGGYAPRSPFSLFSVLNWICWNPPPPKKFLGTALVVKYKFLILGTSYPDTQYLREQGCVDPWLFLEAKAGPASKRVWETLLYLVIPATSTSTAITSLHLRCHICDTL